MLEAINNGYRLIKEGYLISAEPAHNFKDWVLEFKPSIISHTNPIDNQNAQAVLITLKNCIYIDFKGFDHQAETFPTHTSIDLMDWSEVESSELLSSYFNDSQTHPYKPKPIPSSKMSQFHHINFESFAVDIDAICQAVEIKLKPSKAS